MSSTTWQFPKALQFREFRRTVQNRAARWAKKRQGADKHSTTLHSRRIYILPTTVGLVFALMSFTMLLGSMNYNNNMSFLLTFLLTSLGFVAMHQCQRNLVGLEISFAGVDAVFAGQAAEFQVAITNHSKSRRPNLQIYLGGNLSEIADLEPGESRVFHLEIPTHQRGYIRLERFGVRTLFPFELFRAWAWLHMNLQGWSTPRRQILCPNRHPHSRLMVTVNMMLAVRRTLRGSGNITSVIRHDRSRGSPMHAAGTFTRSSSPVLTRAANGLILMQ